MHQLPESLPPATRLADQLPETESRMEAYHLRLIRVHVRPGTLCRSGVRTEPTAVGLSRLRAANSITAFTCSRLSPSNHAMMSSILAPASRFSIMADTGIRVPLRTHAPLTLP